MQKELSLVLNLLAKSEKIENDGSTFYTGIIGNREVVLAQCGIGKVNAALSTQAMINRFSPDLIINTGVAGGAGNGAGILDVVVGSGVAYHDVWCGPGTQWGQAADCPMVFEAPAEILALPALQSSQVRQGLICSGDIFVDSADVLHRIKSVHPDAMAVDMESAAVAHTCHRNNVPFVALRVISDTPGEADNIAQYENFWSDAPQRTFGILENILAQI